MHVLLGETDDDDEEKEYTGRADVLTQLLSLRSSGRFDSACVVAAVETGPGVRVFRTPPFEGPASAAAKDGEQLLYQGNFVLFEEQVGQVAEERKKQASSRSGQPPETAQTGIEPLTFDQAFLERSSGWRAHSEALPQKSEEKAKGSGPEKNKGVPWDRAFRTLVIGEPALGHSNLLWASLIADPEHGAQFAVELLGALAELEPSPAHLKMTSHAYVILEHQLRSSPEWAGAAEREGLCWAMAGGVWEWFVEGVFRAKPEESEEVGDLARDGASLLVAFCECTPRTASFKLMPKRIRKLAADPPEKVWLGQYLFHDLLRTYLRYGKEAEKHPPEDGVPCPKGENMNRGVRRGERRDVRAKVRQGLMIMQWLSEQLGRPELFIGGDRLLLTHDAAAEGDSEVKTLFRFRFRSLQMSWWTSCVGEESIPTCVMSCCCCKQAWNLADDSHRLHFWSILLP